MSRMPALRECLDELARGLVVNEALTARAIIQYVHGDLTSLGIFFHQLREANVPSLHCIEKGLISTREYLAHSKLTRVNIAHVFVSDYTRVFSHLINTIFI